MIGTMTVMKPQAYQRWLEIGTPIETMAAEGKKLFFERGCAGCHNKGSAVRAPELSDFFGKPVALQDGTSIKADEAYLRDSILLPLKNVTAGFDPVMPSYQGQLDEAQVIALIEYIKSRQEISNR
jgi:cytochrome c oxidase subunit 2